MGQAILAIALPLPLYVSAKLKKEPGFFWLEVQDGFWQWYLTMLWLVDVTVGIGAYLVGAQYWDLAVVAVVGALAWARRAWEYG